MRQATETTSKNKIMILSSGVEIIGAAYDGNAPTNDRPNEIFAMHNPRTRLIIMPIRAARIVFLALMMMTTVVIRQVTAAPLSVVEVAPGVFAFQGTHGLMDSHTGGAIANIGFIVGRDAVAVVDTGGTPEQGRRLLETIRTITNCPVRYVILTHMHPDHVFGSAALMGPDVAFVGHARLAAALEARFDHYVAANAATLPPGALDGVVLPAIDRPVADRIEIDLGDRRIEVRAFAPAHTDNDVTVFDPATATLFSGDLVFLGHLPSLDGSLRGWQRAIDALAAIPAARVIPGHGPVPSPWPAALDPERRYFDVLARDLRASIDAGTPMSSAVTVAGRSEAANWTLFDAFNTRNATAAYAELEWE